MLVVLALCGCVPMSTLYIGRHYAALRSLRWANESDSRLGCLMFVVTLLVHLTVRLHSSPSLASIMDSALHVSFALCPYSASTNPSPTAGTAKACEKGVLAGHGFQGVRVVLTDGAAHAVDSNDISFQLAMQYGIRNAVKAARPAIMEPVMNLEVNAPSEFQGNLMGALNKRGKNLQ